MPNTTVVSQNAVTNYVSEQVSKGRSVDDIRISEVHDKLGGRYERVRDFLQNARVAFGKPRISVPNLDEDAEREAASLSKSYIATLKESVKSEDADRIEALERQAETLTGERDDALKAAERATQEGEALRAELAAEREARRDQNAIAETTASLAQSVAVIAKELGAVVSQIKDMQRARSADQHELLSAMETLSDRVQRIAIANDAAADETDAEAETEADEVPRETKRNTG